jgi:hypothetical protein
MWLSTDQLTSPARDLKDATNPDLKVRKALSARIRDACINVGFFYGLAFPQTISRRLS